MIIKIKNLKCHTVIGVYAEEKQRQQLLIINLKIDYDEGVAPRSDKISDTLNYHDLTDSIRNLVEASRYELLESLVEEIGKKVLSYDKVFACEIEIDKPEAPIDCIDSVSVAKSFKKPGGWFPII